MFTERARGRSIASLARELNGRGVACPSGPDRVRNSHRSGSRWIVRTVAMILENPRYTGRQVWNRQSTKGHGAGGRRGGRGSGAVRRNDAVGWEVSERLAHAPLVDEATFLAVQRIRAERRTKDGGTREYALSGLVVCGLCGRRMEAHWVHGRPGYRCRHGYSTATPRPKDGPRNVYVREEHLLQAAAHLLPADRPDGTRSPREIREALNDGQLEISCSLEGRELRPAEARQAVCPARPPDQLTLDLGCGLHADTEPEHWSEAAEEDFRTLSAAAEQSPSAAGLRAPRTGIETTPRILESVG
ncbi:recombinase family protein [Amycolatopsis sp. VS8301801F10]|uniref:recombinase family protein n=1 Tax=Amycolatopsis sp. VS8301801F10 TaxID=2652442 RepID=UPI0038FCAF5C